MPPSCLAFAIYLKHCILGSTYVRSIVISFLTHRSAHIFILHPHSHELQYPISILLCLSLVVDCRVDIESSLSRHSLSANHQLNDILPPIDLHILNSTQQHFRIVWRHQLIVVYPRCLITVCTVYPPSIHQRTFQIDTIVAIVTVRIK